MKPPGKELDDEEVEVHRGADCLCVEAGGDGHVGSRGYPADGRVGADVLPVEEGVWRAGRWELRRVKQLEDENRKLKQLVADLSLDKHILQDVLSKKL